MRLLDILQGRLVVPRMRSRDKWSALEELVDALVEEHELRLVDRREVLEAVIEQEKIRASGLPGGAALPHGRSRVLEDLLGVLGVAPAGIPFDASDGQDARVICLLAIPETQYRDHVKTLADVARRLADAQFCAELLEAAQTGSAAGVIAALERIEGPAFLQE